MVDGRRHCQERIRIARLGIDVKKRSGAGRSAVGGPESLIVFLVVAGKKTFSVAANDISMGTVHIVQSSGCVGYTHGSLGRPVGNPEPLFGGGGIAHGKCLAFLVHREEKQFSIESGKALRCRADSGFYIIYVLHQVCAGIRTVGYPQFRTILRRVRTEKYLIADYCQPLRVAAFTAWHNILNHTCSYRSAV